MLENTNQLDKLINPITSQVLIKRISPFSCKKINFIMFQLPRISLKYNEVKLTSLIF
jgi:hypothetical protein